MFIESLISLPGWVFIPLIGVVLTSCGLHNKYAYGINHIPGPFLATFTDYWRFFNVWGRRPERTHVKLHQKYGDLVRIGPNTVLVADWSAVKKIYALNAGYIKSDFYPVQQNISNGKPLHSLFNTNDEKFHSKLRRHVANAYSMSNLVQFEPMVDSTITAFINQLEKRFVGRPGGDGVIDFGLWLQYYAFDVIGELTFSQRLGFVDQGKDIDGVITTLERMLNYFAVIGQIPWLDRLFLKNPLLLWANDHGLIDSTSPVVTFARARMASRLTQDEGEKADPKSSTPARLDFLDRFLMANKKDPEFISSQRVLALTVANVFAGSDTTAITLRAVFYFLMKHPKKLHTLLSELDNADLGSREELVPWEKARNLPYLSAVIQESLRLHPATGLSLERYVPSSGLDASGVFIPSGTIVGANAWAVHAKESIFGAKTAEYRPERWIEVSESQRSEMNNALFSFGMGARTCIGKNISLLEMYKLVPTILRQYEITFANENSEWTLHNAWFVKQLDFYVRIKRRS
ncbi:Pisatin demethylase 12 [Phlyctema vagabunda]|uniref:Pisatin demethylase 12 n=1 Tax=Phlyctema vagabunda TaxID=108571 RepID=A0ABR4P4E6_9HELO